MFERRDELETFAVERLPTGVRPTAPGRPNLGVHLSSVDGVSSTLVTRTK